MCAESKHPQHIEYDDNRCASQAQLYCANCDIAILWPPIVVREKAYCCTGCAAGGPCNCDYSQYRSTNIAGVIRYGI